MKTSYVFFADGFEEIEALSVVDVLRRAGMPVVTVSINGLPQAEGAHGVTVVTDAVVSDIAGDVEAEWLIMPGGMPGASNLAACQCLVELLLAQYESGRGVAAICASPAVVLGPLGMVNGRKAVCYPGMEAGLTGADVQATQVAVDGNVVTGNGPAAASRFALALVQESLGVDAAAEVAAGMLIS